MEIYNVEPSFAGTTSYETLPDIGYVGDNEVHAIAFNLSSIVAEYPDIIPSVVVINTESETYFAPKTALDGGTFTWTITSAETVEAGTLKVQLKCATPDGAVTMSQLYKTTVYPSLEDTGDLHNRMRIFSIIPSFEGTNVYFTLPDIGYVGDNESFAISFDMAQLVEKYADVVPSLTVTNPSGDTFIAPKTTWENSIFTWIITKAETAVDGTLKIQLQCKTPKGVVAKSQLYKTTVYPSLTDQGESASSIRTYSIVPSFEGTTVLFSLPNLGYVGDNESFAISFDLSQLVARFPEVQPYIIVSNVAGETYIASNTTWKNSIFTWVITSIETASEGTLRVQLKCETPDGVVAMSRIFKTQVFPSLEASDQTPEAFQSWLDNLTELATETREYVAESNENVESSYENAKSAANSASDAATSEVNAKASEEASATSETNAKASEEAAATSEVNAKASEEASEAWAVGQRNGADVESTDETYQNNSKYYAGKTAEDRTVVEGIQESLSDTVTRTETATERANIIAEELESITATAETLDETADATASYDHSTSVLSLGIPRGVSAKIASQAVEYQISDSGSVIPSGDWTSDMPETQQGEFLWTRLTITWNDGTENTLYSFSRDGIDGIGTVNSVNGYTPDENNNVTLPFDTTPTKSSENPVTSGGVYESKPFVVTATIAASGTTITVSDSRITANTRVIDWVPSNWNYMTSDVTWTTSAGSIKLTAADTLSTECTFTMTLQEVQS